MSLQRLALFDALTRANAQTIDGVWVETEIRHNLTKRSVCLNAQVASDIYFESNKEVWDVQDGDFPPLRPAYPRMWIEWTIPKTWNSNGKVITGGLGYTAGVQLTECPPGPDAPPGTTSVLLMNVAAMAIGCLPRLIPTSVVIFLDENGMVTTGVRLLINGPPDHGVEVLVQPALLALGLLNCRNVTTGKRNFRPHTAGGNNRKKTPKIDYHTIILPGTVQESTGKRLSSNKALLPKHRVRGHFKTFTTQAPLMGRHVGTYWWGWQVRGNPNNGVTITDYRVGAV